MILNQYCELREASSHGRGVFASKDIPSGTRIIRYTGEHISTQEGERRCKIQKEQGAIYLFILDDDTFIDGSVGGSGAQFINHSCEPNCESDFSIKGEIWIKSIRDIKKGEELFYEYCIDDEEVNCRCGSLNCKGKL